MRKSFTQFTIRSFIGPDSFGFVESVSVLAMVIIGGVGSVWAVLATAAFLSVVPMVFQFVDEYKLLLYSALLFFYDEVFTRDT